MLAVGLHACEEIGIPRKHLNGLLVALARNVVDATAAVVGQDLLEALVRALGDLRDTLDDAVGRLLGDDDANGGRAHRAGGDVDTEGAAGRRVGALVLTVRRILGDGLGRHGGAAGVGSGGGGVGRGADDDGGLNTRPPDGVGVGAVRRTTLAIFNFHRPG